MVYSRTNPTQLWAPVNERFLLDYNQANLILQETGLTGLRERPGFEYKIEDPLETRRELVAYDGYGVEHPLGDLWKDREQVRSFVGKLVYNPEAKATQVVTGFKWDGKEYVYDFSNQPVPDNSNGLQNFRHISINAGRTLTDADLDAIVQRILMALPLRG